MTNNTSKRPLLIPTMSEKDFRNYYWLKVELTQFCKELGLSTLGGKEEISQRIAYFLKNGMKLKSSKAVSQPKINSYNQSLSLSTIVSKSFTCSRIVRDFFESEVGPEFKFSVLLQNYIKNNPGITFADIITEYYRQKECKKKGELKTNIGPQFEYNQFTRSYFLDPVNACKSRDDCIAAWKDYKSKPKY